VGLGIGDVIEILNSIYNGVLTENTYDTVIVDVSIDKKKIKAIEVETTESEVGTRAYKINMRSEKE
jgi:hypothetical protein